MTDAELTILSLIAEGPRYGYEIQQIIDERGLREWLTIGFSSIYYILNKLERQNMLSSQLKRDGPGPARKVYAITEAGRGVLQTAIAELLRQPRALGSGFELGLINMQALKPKQIYIVLRHHQQDLQERHGVIAKAWQRHQQETNPMPDHIRALYTHSIALMESELIWLADFLEDWRKQYPGVARDEVHPSEIDSEATRVHHPTEQNDPAKMIQRIKRPPQKNGE